MRSLPRAMGRRSFQLIGKQRNEDDVVDAQNDLQKTQGAKGDQHIDGKEFHVPKITEAWLPSVGNWWITFSFLTKCALAERLHLNLFKPIKDPFMELQQLESTATQIRRDIVRMVHGAQSGHPGGSLGCAEFFTALFFDQLDHRPDAFDMAGSGKISSSFPMDIFLRSITVRWPVRVISPWKSWQLSGPSMADCKGIRPPMKGFPGVRIASGSLGQGLSVSPEPH